METNVFAEAWQFILVKKDVVISALVSHIMLVIWASLIAITLGVFTGIVISRKKKVRDVVIGVVGVLYTIPILALFGFLIPIMGIGIKPAVIALTIYGILPIIRNTCVGIEQVSPAAKEAAIGMGANKWQLLFRVELPLAFPVIFAGIRTSVVMNFSVATYAIFIGGGGMGGIIMQGMRTYNDAMLIAGTLVVAIATILLDRLIGQVERKINEHYGL
ncbi:MAG: ABC transporter permease [Thermacetogeniaceae bacterium]